MASLENKYGKSAVDATRRNALPPYLDTLFEGGIGGGAGVETHNVTLTAANWSNLQQNVVLTCGATNASDIVCAGDNSTMDADYYLSAFGVKLTSASVVEGEEEGVNTVTFTFTAESTPTTNINVVIIIVNASTEGGVPVATISRVGVVKPDGTTISIDSNGTIHSIGGGGGGGSVTGVKGDTETDYRVGDVNLTPQNIGAVPTTTTVNGHALTGDITISKSDVGLGNVNNTSDLNKPISTATQTALNAKVNKTDIATTSNLGLVKPDGSTITIDTDGTIHSMGGSGGGTSIYYFYQQGVSVASYAEILRISSNLITENTIVLECTFNTPFAISGGVTWTSYNGYISFIGTCIKATKANVVLANKGN